jgi:hypothetical protein
MAENEKALGWARVRGRSLFGVGMFNVVLSLFVVALLSFSSRQASAQATLPKVFKYDMLNAQVAYLEHIIGPAIHINPGTHGGQIRDYRVDGCEVQAIVNGNAQGTPSIQAYSLTLTRKCNFNLAAFQLRPLSTRDLTIAKTPEANFLGFESDCIDLCGNAVDPTVDFLQYSSHATNWVGVVYTIVLADDPALNAIGKLRDVMQAREGHDYTENTKFNCDQKYGDTAVKLFAAVPVNKITVGIFPGDPGGRCQ